MLKLNIFPDSVARFVSDLSSMPEAVASSVASGCEKRFLSAITLSGETVFCNISPVSSDTCHPITLYPVDVIQRFPTEST